MKARKYTGDEIVDALRQVAAGASAVSVCRDLGVTQTTFYRWRKKYEGAGVTQIQELRTLREENIKLKQIVADFVIERQDRAIARHSR